MTDHERKHEQPGDVVPRCRHGRIILACDDDTCPEQNAYLAAQNAAMDTYDEQMRANARAAFGLVERKPR